MFIFHGCFRLKFHWLFLFTQNRRVVVNSNLSSYVRAFSNASHSLQMKCPKQNLTVKSPVQRGVDQKSLVLSYHYCSILG